VKIEILDEAQEDLIQGFQFYEAREPGPGSYFLDCLLSDIDSLPLFAGIHLPTAIIDASLNAFRLPFTTAWREAGSCLRCAGLS
jgi:hypothetical protein